MADLYIAALGTPYRAVVAHANGRRAFVKIGERRDDDFALEPTVWTDVEGALVGAHAAFLERGTQQGDCFRVKIGATDVRTSTLWTERDLLATIVRRFLVAAETQAGEPMQRVVCVVPPKTSPDVRDGCAQAALLAGAFAADVLSLDRLVVPVTASPASGAPSVDERLHLLVEVWDDLARLTLAGPSGDARTLEADAELSPARMCATLGAAFSLGPEFAAGLHDEIARELFDRWIGGTSLAHGVTVVRPAVRSAPVAVFVPASAFAKLDAGVAASLARVFADGGIRIDRIVDARVAGSWTRPIAAALRTLLGASVPVRDDRGIELDLAIERDPPAAHGSPPTLSLEVLAVPPSARSLRALSRGEPVPLVPAGARLPATSVTENFASNSFIETFWVATRASDATTPMLSFAIPRYAERQSNSYLRTVVHCDTPELMLLEVAYLYPTLRRFAFFDKRRGCEVPVSEHAFRVVRG